MRTTAAPPKDDSRRIRYAKVLVEVGYLLDAEHEVASALEARADDTEALALLTKIKHIRGELSLALAGWRELHGRQRREAPTARLRLTALLHLAQQPTPPVAVLELANTQVLRKPLPYVELEHAFRAFLSGRPPEARARCRLVALRCRARDAELYKLAVLAEAWMAEQTGDLSSSCALLEHLGQDRLFAADLDRVLALASLYERIGTREKLEAATHIHRFLARSIDGFSAYGHLSELYRKLGDEERARAAEREQVLEFRTRMLRPSLADVIDVGASRYVPLPLLCAASLEDDGLTSNATREEALRLALRGALDEARQHFEDGGELLDAKYLADLEALAGHEDEARARALAAAREDPRDLWLTWRLLDGAQERAHADVAAHFSSGEPAARAREALLSRLDADPRDAVQWRRLATLERLAPQASESVVMGAAERASALEGTAEARLYVVGRALAASVYAFPGGAREGLIHEVWAGKEPVGRGEGGALKDEHIFGNLTPEMKKDVKSTFLAVREYARAKLPHKTERLYDFRYTYKVTKEDEPSGGASAGLPTALAFLSVFTDEPLPQDVAATGQIVTDAHDVLTVHAVGDIAYKLRAVCHRNLRALLSPLMNKADLEASPLVPRAVSLEMARYVATLDDAVRLLFGERFFG